ncbi:MAG: ribonuclease III [Burkholderiaceae bacterium]|jgi:ribonuclease-3|nr:ribonuclease III [Burkholderiaceae bacterium]
MSSRTMIDLKLLQERLGYQFQKPELLTQALTHRSHSKKNNERLEFLGDSVLNCAVAEILYERYGDLDEGDLSRLRANLVKQQALYEIAQALQLSDALRLGEGELKSGGFKRPSILADTFEAIVGAIFLEAGFDAARQVLRKWYSQILEHVDPRTLGKDDKTLLQEFLQGHQLPLPVYNVIATTGVAHNQQFEVECAIVSLKITVSGQGASRRAAEQAAAKLALDAAQKAIPQTGRKPRKTKASKKTSVVTPANPQDDQLNLTLKTKET